MTNAVTSGGPTPLPRSKTFGRIKPHDPEKGPIRPDASAQGFSELAAFFSSDTERSIWPRFCYLSTLDLVYKAEELSDAEIKLRKYDKEEQEILNDPANPRRDVVLQCATSHAAFKRYAQTDEYYKGKMELLTHIRAMLDEYSTTRPQVFVEDH